MRTNLKVILSAVGVAALLASPAMAKTKHHQAAPSVLNVPRDARASVGSYAPAERVYAPDVAPYGNRGVSRDFQLEGRE